MNFPSAASRALKFALAFCLTTVVLGACAVTYPSAISDANTRHTLNELSADSAPQQTVVNGWTANDYLELIAWQNTERSVLLYVSIALLFALLVTIRRQARGLEVFMFGPDGQQAIVRENEMESLLAKGWTYSQPRSPAAPS